MTRLPALLGLALFAPLVTAQDADDPFLWLEDVEGDSALAWVEARNAETLDHYRAGPDFAPIYDRTLDLLTSSDRVPFPSIRGEWLYNFWTDDDNPRGLWRRTSWADYLGGDPTWETLLDIDALGEAEGVNWAYKGSSCLEPEERRCLVRLSRGGGGRGRDARVRRRDPAVRRGRLFPPRGQGRDGLGRREHPPRRHRLRPCLDDDVGLPARRQAVATGDPRSPAPRRSTRASPATSACGPRRSAAARRSSRS